MGNLLLLRTMIVLKAIHIAGKGRSEPYTVGSHEHPATAYSWHCKEVILLFSHKGCGTVDIAYCSFGAPYPKNTRLGFIFATRLLSFEGRICRGGHSHIRLEGSLTTHAAAYPPGLCAEWADVIWATIHYSTRPLDLLEEEEGPRAGALEDLYYNELLEAAPWAMAMKEPVGVMMGGRRPHINISEVRGCLRTIRKRGMLGYNTRQVYGLDSQVGIGVLAKGRSPSHALNDELRLGLPYTISYRHYPGYKFSPTRLNRADDPTRDRPVRPSRGCPEFVQDMLGGDCDEWDAWIKLPRQCRAISPWAHFVVRLLRPTQLRPWSSLLAA